MLCFRDPKWKHHHGKISREYVRDARERRKSRSERRKTLCVKAHELVSRCGGEIFLQYIDENNVKWTYCSSDELWRKYREEGIRLTSSEYKLEVSNEANSNGAFNNNVTTSAVLDTSISTESGSPVADAGPDVKDTCTTEPTDICTTEPTDICTTEPTDVCATEPTDTCTT